MEAAIVIVWIIALVGALVLTVLVLTEVFRVVHHAREIRRLALVTLPAAVGIVENTSTLAALPGVGATVGRLLATAEAIAGVASRIERHTIAVGRTLSGKGTA